MNYSLNILEICVDDPAGLDAALSGGADRIELCSALVLGGLTPSRAFARRAVEASVPIHAMVRPLAGDFVYCRDEIALMEEEIRDMREIGVAGVVVGAAGSDGWLNVEALSKFRDAARDLSITLHRVVDLTPDPVEAVGVAASLGYDYVLTSGGAPTAFEGRETIRRMVAEAAGRLAVIAGAGVTAGNAARLIADSGVAQIHASASRPGGWTDVRIQALGFAGPRRITDSQTVAELKLAIGDV